nr:hypothetical protein CFP56_09865 [Quercus suber]
MYNSERVRWRCDKKHIPASVPAAAELRSQGRYRRCEEVSVPRHGLSAVNGDVTDFHNHDHIDNDSQINVSRHDHHRM